MSTIDTTTAVTPKYDVHYKVEDAVQVIRMLGEVLGEIVKSEQQVDVSKLPDLFESSKDMLLYTLGWLEPKKAASDERIQNSARELCIGVVLLIQKNESSADLAVLATTYHELAYALEQFANHAARSQLS